MYKLCKWLYDLAYKRGYEEGRLSVYGELEAEKNLKKLIEEMQA